MVRFTIRVLFLVVRDEKKEVRIHLTSPRGAGRNVADKRESFRVAQKYYIMFVGACQ